MKTTEDNPEFPWASKRTLPRRIPEPPPSPEELRQWLRQTEAVIAEAEDWSQKPPPAESGE